MSQKHEEYDYMFVRDKEKYFCLEHTKDGAVLHCENMFALHQKLLGAVQEEIRLLMIHLEHKDEGIFVHPLCRTSMTREIWMLQFCADQLVLAGYQWIGIPTIVTVRGNIADLAFVHERFHHLFARQDLPFRQ